MLADVINGFLDAESARSFYGVHINPDLRVDVGATERERGPEDRPGDPHGGIRDEDWLDEHAERISLPAAAAAAVRASWEQRGDRDA